jgi:hypothetical protein
VRSVFLSILAIFLIASPAIAWDEAGHELIAEIAFDLLSDGDQQHFVEILRAHPRFKEDFVSRMPDAIATATESEKARWLFAQASIWPDIIRNLGEEIRLQHHRGTWHYINLPVFLTEQDEKQFTGQLIYNLSSDFAPPLRHELNLIQALKGNLLVWRDATASKSEKAIALCWILHLAGDIHAPLHNVALFSKEYFAEGDRGGNLIGIKRDRATTNLHAIWDGLANYLDDVTPDENTRKLLANDVANIESMAGWARDGQQLSKDFAYTEEIRSKLLAEPPRRRNSRITLSTEYLATAEKTATRQIIIAGHRIAALLTNK